MITIRPARTADVRAIKVLVDTYVDRGILLTKDLRTLYEDLPDFLVAVDDRGVVRACGAIHVLWEDIAELRTLAVDPTISGQGVGHRMVTELLAMARRLGVRQVFCLTFEVRFFASHGFIEIESVPVAEHVYEALLRSPDEGVAQFLNLERVRPNTLGNSRMLLTF